MVPVSHQGPVAAALLFAGCATRSAQYESVQPTSQTPAGMPAAFYEIRLGSSALGHVKVWSPDGFRTEQTEGDASIGPS